MARTGTACPEHGLFRKSRSLDLNDLERPYNWIFIEKVPAAHVNLGQLTRPLKTSLVACLSDIVSWRYVLEPMRNHVISKIVTIERYNQVYVK